MDIFRSSATGIDTYINSTVYSGLSSSEGIDLRTETRRILYGGNGRLPKGHWVILRKYDRSTTASGYNRYTHEGVGSSGYNYTDHLLRTRQVPVSKSSDKTAQLTAGLDLTDLYIYYFEYNINPNIGDDIFELDIDNHATTPNPNVAKTARYKIKRIHPYRLEQGNIQYWAVVAQNDEVDY